MELIKYKISVRLGDGVAPIRRGAIFLEMIYDFPGTGMFHYGNVMKYTHGFVVFSDVAFIWDPRMVFLTLGLNSLRICLLIDIGILMYNGISCITRKAALF